MQDVCLLWPGLWTEPAEHRREDGNDGDDHEPTRINVNARVKGLRETAWLCSFMT